MSAGNLGVSCLGGPDRNVTGTDEIRLRPRRGLIALSCLTAVGFVALGAWEFIYFSARDIPAALIGPVCVVFFGWVALRGFARLRSDWSMTISPEGFTIPGPTFRSKLVRWVDVESFGLLRIQRQKLVLVRLRDTANLVAQYSADEVRRLLQTHNRLLGFGRLVAALSANQSRETDLPGFFRNQRHTYGGDVILGWLDRDRGAEAFVGYLESFRRRHVPTVAEVPA